MTRPRRGWDAVTALPPPPVKLQCFFCPRETYNQDGICGQCRREGKNYGPDPR